jgi:transposase
MEDTSYRQFFTDADSTTYHRRYEALRAVFVDGLRQDDVADRYGYTHGSMRQLVHQFRTAIRSGSPPPFFKSRRSAGRHAPISIARAIR